MCHSDRDCRVGDAAHRRIGHVGVLDAGHHQRATAAWTTPQARRRSHSAAPGGPSRNSRHMNVLVYLVPMALALGLTGLVAFLWSLRAGQYEDMDGAALRVLSDDDVTPGVR